MRVLSTFPGAQFKIGDSAAGLLRPDKLVAYFQTPERLAEALRAGTHRSSGEQPGDGRADHEGDQDEGEHPRVQPEEEHRGDPSAQVGPAPSPV